MPQIKAPVNYTNGQTVDADGFNNHVNGAVLETGAITEHDALPAGTLAATAKLLTYNTVLNKLETITALDITNSGLAVKTNSITGSNADLVITPAATYKTVVNGQVNFGGLLNLAGNVVSTANIQVKTLSVDSLTQDKVGITGIKAFTLPSGTTANRPATPAIGDTRFNTEKNTLEVYKGSAWENPAIPVSTTTICYDEVDELKANIKALRITPGIDGNGNTSYANFNASKALGGADVRYTETFVVPAGEKWVINFGMYVWAWSSDDRWCMAWVYDGNIEQFHESDILSSNWFWNVDLTYTKIIDNSTGTSALTKVIEFKASPMGGTGGDTTFFGDFKGWKTPQHPASSDILLGLTKWSRKIRKYKRF